LVFEVTIRSHADVFATYGFWRGFASSLSDNFAFQDIARLNIKWRYLDWNGGSRDHCGHAGKENGGDELELHFETSGGESECN